VQNFTSKFSNLVSRSLIFTKKQRYHICTK